MAVEGEWVAYHVDNAVVLLARRVPTQELHRSRALEPGTRGERVGERDVRVVLLSLRND